MNDKKAKKLRKLLKVLSKGNLERRYESKDKIKMIEGQSYMMCSAINDPTSYRGIYRRLKNDR